LTDGSGRMVNPGLHDFLLLLLHLIDLKRKLWVDGVVEEGADKLGEREMAAVVRITRLDNRKAAMGLAVVLHGDIEKLLDF